MPHCCHFDKKSLACLSFFALQPHHYSYMPPKTGKIRFFVEEKPLYLVFGRVFVVWKAKLAA